MQLSDLVVDEPAVRVAHAEPTDALSMFYWDCTQMLEAFARFQGFLINLTVDPRVPLMQRAAARFWEEALRECTRRTELGAADVGVWFAPALRGPHHQEPAEDKAVLIAALRAWAGGEEVR